MGEGEREINARAPRDEKNKQMKERKRGEKKRKKGIDMWLPRDASRLPLGLLTPIIIM